MAAAIFDFYEVVTVLPSPRLPPSIWNSSGVVVGRGEDAHGRWDYAVLVAADNDLCWSIDEAALESQGRKLKREDIYPGNEVRVTVDPETGAGSMAGPVRTKN